MQGAPSLLKRAALVLAATAGLSLAAAGPALAATDAPTVAPTTAASHWDRCDDWGHRWDRDCQREARWYHHRDRWGHDYWDHYRWHGDRWGHGYWEYHR